MTSGTPPTPPAEDAVALTITADPSALPLARIVAMSCGALANLPMDRIDDLCQCTQEALSLLLTHGCAGSLTVRFEPSAGDIGVIVTGSGLGAAAPDSSSFAWLLLTELAGAADYQHTGEVLAVTFHVGRTVSTTSSISDLP